VYLSIREKERSLSCLRFLDLGLKTPEHGNCDMMLRPSLDQRTDYVLDLRDPPMDHEVSPDTRPLLHVGGPVPVLS